MINLAMVSNEVFEILKSFGYTQTLYDDLGNRTESPLKARRIFVKKEDLLLSINDDNNYSNVTLYIGQANNIGDFINLIETLRTTCSKYNLLFNVSTYDGEIKPNELIVSETIKRNIFMNLFEGMYGTMDTSYLTLENAKMVVKHSENTKDMKKRAKCIESIMLEDSFGNTIQFPNNQILAAKAMTQHLNHNGNFADKIGNQICRMANDFKNLGMAINYTNTVTNTSEPVAYAVVQEACKSQFKKIKENFNKLYENYNDTVKLFSMIREDEDREIKDEDQLEEMSDLLMKKKNKCPDAVVEASCKAMRKEKKSLKDVMKLKENHEEMVSVLGKPIDKKVWDDFKHGVMATTSRFKDSFFDNSPIFKNKTAEFVYKLTRLIPKIENHALSNIISSVVDSVEDEHNQDRKKKLIAVGLTALKNAGIELDDGLTSPVIKEYDNWISSFNVINESPEEIKVFGKSIPKTIWDSLKKGVIELSGKPNLNQEGPRFANKKSEILYKLQRILPYIKNDALHNLLAEVSDDVETEKNREKKMQYLGLINHVVKNVDSEMVHESTTDNNHDYVDIDPDSHDWCVYDGTTDETIARFSSEEAAENFLKKIKVNEDEMYGLLDENNTFDNFDVNDFWESDARKEVIGSGKDETISRHDLYLALKQYYDDSIKNGTDDMKDTADNLDELANDHIQEVVNYAIEHGYQVVDDKNNLEKIKKDEDAAEEDDILNPEDIMLPADDQYVGFRDEVIAKTARDPITGKEVDTDGDYLSRIKTLAGIKQSAEFDNGY